MKALPSLPRLACALVLVALLPACNNNRDDTNPFADAAQTAPPPKGAALIFASSVYSLTAGAGRELFAVNADGSNLTRLTFCNNLSACDYAEASAAPDRVRVGARRASVDTNGDGRVDEADGMGLVFVNLERGVEALLVPASRRVTGVDWAPTSGTFFVYSALPAGGGAEDLFTIDFNGQNDRNLTCPSDPSAQCDVTVRERRPRLDASESAAAFQRLLATGAVADLHLRGVFQPAHPHHGTGRRRPCLLAGREAGGLSPPDRRQGEQRPRELGHRDGVGLRRHGGAGGGERSRL